ncbi:hypothetical protein PP714_05725 [Lacticaseibacillus paracasei]|nr:hypothetical protein [Lacticaseibacillus paracasei]
MGSRLFVLCRDLTDTFEEEQRVLKPKQDRIKGLIRQLMPSSGAVGMRVGGIGEHASFMITAISICAPLGW